MLRKQSYINHFSSRHDVLLQRKVLLAIRRHAHAGSAQEAQVVGPLLDGLSPGPRHERRRVRPAAEGTHQQHRRLRVHVGTLVPRANDNRPVSAVVATARQMVSRLVHVARC